jgi:hypothetical protein
MVVVDDSGHQAEAVNLALLRDPSATVEAVIGSSPTL